MRTNANDQQTQRTAFIDITANMLEVLPGDIIIIKPKSTRDTTVTTGQDHSVLL